MELIDGYLRVTHEGKNVWMRMMQFEGAPAVTNGFASAAEVDIAAKLHRATRGERDVGLTG
jgi:hypothetical protein